MRFPTTRFARKLHLHMLHLEAFALQNLVASHPSPTPPHPQRSINLVCKCKRTLTDPTPSPPHPIPSVVSTWLMVKTWKFSGAVRGGVSKNNNHWLVNSGCESKGSSKAMRSSNKFRGQLLVANGLGRRRQLSDELFKATNHPHHAAFVQVALIP